MLAASDLTCTLSLRVTNNHTATVTSSTQDIHRVSSGILITPSGTTCLSQKRMATAPIASAIRAAIPSTAILTEERSVESTGIKACSQIERWTEDLKPPSVTRKTCLLYTSPSPRD